MISLSLFNSNLEEISNVALLFLFTMGSKEINRYNTNTFYLTS